MVPWSLGSLGVSLGLWGLPHGFGVAPGAVELPQGLWGCPWSFGVSPGAEESPQGKGTIPFLGAHPKNEFGYNLQHMALFEAMSGGLDSAYFFKLQL